jgi:hypothetical protein
MVVDDGRGWWWTVAGAHCGVRAEKKGGFGLDLWRRKRQRTVKSQV